MSIALPAFSKSRVLIVGDVMLDRYWTGPTQRISPEAPVPVVNVNDQENRPGGAANVALNVAALGAQATIIGRTGDDENANILETHLNSMNVNCGFTHNPGIETITKLRILSRHQQLIRLDFEQPLHQLPSDDLLAQTREHLSGAGMLVLSDYNKGTLNCVEQLISEARSAKVPVLVDPKGSDFSKYRGATLLTPNMAEFEQIVGPCTSEQDLVDKGQKLLEELMLEALLITRSEKGMTLLQKGSAEVHFPAQAREVYDVTGAGDTVISTLASALSAGASLVDACALANTAASIVVGKVGTSTVSELELARELLSHSELQQGVMSEDQLKMLMETARKRGDKVVMTNGCFDILHAGHVSYLQQAAALGDRLIVAVNDDDSVRRLKGDGRPVNPTERRMAVLAGLGAVDWVIPFSEDTPQRVIGELLPDILVKGGDYKVEEIAGGKEVMANGGEVKVLNFEDGCSTTEIINKIKR